MSGLPRSRWCARATTAFRTISTSSSRSNFAKYVPMTLVTRCLPMFGGSCRGKAISGVTRFGNGVNGGVCRTHAEDVKSGSGQYHLLRHQLAAGTTTKHQPLHSLHSMLLQQFCMLTCMHLTLCTAIPLACHLLVIVATSRM